VGCLEVDCVEAADHQVVGMGHLGGRVDEEIGLEVGVFLFAGVSWRLD